MQECLEDPVFCKAVERERQRRSASLNWTQKSERIAKGTSIFSIPAGLVTWSQVRRDPARAAQRSRVQRGVPRRTLQDHRGGELLRWAVRQLAARLHACFSIVRVQKD